MGFFLSGDYGMLIEIITEYTLRYFLDILEPSIFDGDFLGVTSQDGHRKFPAGQQRAAATGREEPGTGHGHGGPRRATGGHKDLFNTGQMGCVFSFV